jgi:hypothetical protein
MQQKAYPTYLSNSYTLLEKYGLNNKYTYFANIGVIKKKLR